MTIAALNFSATLPTFDALGANGTVFTNKTLPTTGSLLVSTGSSAQNPAAVLAGSLNLNGLNYVVENSSISGDLIDVIYGLPSTASTDDQLQASDQFTALSNGYPGAGIAFSADGGGPTATLSARTYNLGSSGTVSGSTYAANAGESQSSNTNGVNLSILNIAIVDNPPGASSTNAIDVTYEISSASTPQASAVSSVNVEQSNQVASDGTAGHLSVVANLPLTDTIFTSQSSSGTGALSGGGSKETTLAGVLLPTANHQLGLYSVIGGSSAPSSSGTILDLFA